MFEASVENNDFKGYTAVGSKDNRNTYAIGSEDY